MPPRYLAPLPLLLALISVRAAEPSPILKSEFIYESAPFPSCHASTIAETPSGLVAAWFGGTAERNRDVGIWMARENRGHWGQMVEVANGRQENGTRFPCWNPVLIREKKALQLFYKVGPSPSSWWGMEMSSEDDGQAWSVPRRLPEGFLGPIKNKPVLLANGSLLCGSSTENSGWKVHMERRKDDAWTKTESLNTAQIGAIQPAILVHSTNNLQILCRTRNKFIAESRSTDGGQTWSEMKATNLPNPNSGIDAATLQDGRSVVVYNHTTSGRTPLNIAISRDGAAWSDPIALETEPGEYSYPAVIQTKDGLIHITYTWKRQRIKHAVVDPARLTESRSNAK